MTLEILMQVLNQLGQATLVVSCDLNVAFLSATAKNILDQSDGLFIANNKLLTSTASESAHLKKLLNETVHTCAKNGGRSTNGINAEMYVSRPSNKQPLHLRLVPVTPVHIESSGYGQVIIMVRDLEANFTGLTKRLQENFHLTPRECECATMLAEGVPLNEIAEQMNISEQTIREHLKHMFMKMKVNKQHELVAKLLRLQRQR
jgi:DNA-binding CsgD family transcriptional regulator